MFLDPWVGQEMCVIFLFSNVCHKPTNPWFLTRTSHFDLPTLHAYFDMLTRRHKWFTYISRWYYAWFHAWSSWSFLWPKSTAANSLTLRSWIPVCPCPTKIHHLSDIKHTLQIIHFPLTKHYLKGRRLQMQIILKMPCRHVNETCRYGCTRQYICFTSF